MARIALFGSSYIARLGRFCNENLEVPGICKFFGKGGMRSDNVPENMLQELIDFHPDIVFVHLGGNDISTTSNPQDTYDRLMTIHSQLQQSGVKHVFIAEIITRGDFKKTPGLKKLDFDLQRLKINQLLRRRLGDTNFVHLQEIKFPADYDNDLVHIREGHGMRKYQMRITNVLRKCLQSTS